MTSDTTDPWRYRCPEGHGNVTRNTTADRADPQGARYYCDTCKAGYDHVIDRKTGETTTDADPHRPPDDDFATDGPAAINDDDRADETKVNQEMIVECIEDLLALGYRDGMAGGISPVVLGDILPWGQSSVAHHCRLLCDDGALVEVHGTAREKRNKPRPSFLPVDHPDAPDRESRDGPPRTLAEVADD